MPTVQLPSGDPESMEGRREITVYLVRGTRLEGVPRKVAEWRPQTSLDVLLAGPTRNEAVSGLRTALSPQDLAVLPGPVDAGTATISVSREFAGIRGGN